MSLSVVEADSHLCSGTLGDGVPAVQRRRLSLGGRVQGVGMRPFVCRLAQELGLTGWVGNALQGVVIEVEGTEAALDQFGRRVLRDAPRLARVTSCDVVPLPAGGTETDFRIGDSLNSGQPQPVAPPDLAPCPACARELFDPANRRYRYPFISCCECGPRYSILRALPFDRERTVMADFPLCPDCLAEYGDPNNPRFHAQTVCCPACGPRLSWLDPDGRTQTEGETALMRAVVALRDGRIVALQGVGGFQLLADAGNGAALRELRRRKHRPAKPFAVLAEETMIRALCEVSPAEREWLNSRAAPIVLLRRKGGGGTVSAEVAPGLTWLGVMLPASPLHLLLLKDFGAPLVATSGNRSNEPICIDAGEARSRLGGIADGFLVHDRPILRPLDDSVLRIAAGGALMLRRARGFVPEPIELAEPLPPLLAAGGHLKNTVAVGAGHHALLSQHLGDLDDALTQRQCATTLAELPDLFGIQPQAVACDKHPDYASSRLAESFGLPIVRIPHHYAHALACMAEHNLKPPFLALAWDGLGLGDDGTLWGGEFLIIEERGYRRMASFLPLPLIGGEKAVREPRRVALAALHGIHGGDCLEHLPATLRDAFPSMESSLPVEHAPSFPPLKKGGRGDFPGALPRQGQKIPPNPPLGKGGTGKELEVFLHMLERGLQTPSCSSVGRLFDAVSALLGLCFVNRFEGEAAMQLEAAAEGNGTEESAPYPFGFLSGEPLRVDWRPLLRELLAEQSRGVPAGRLAARFHATLAEIALHVATLAGFPSVVLCGGCFQNRLLLEACDARLREAGYAVHWPQRIPPNDGGLALGQLLGAARQLREP